MIKRSAALAWLGAVSSRIPRAGARDGVLDRRLQFEQLRNLYAVTQYGYRTSIIFAVLVFLNFFPRVPYGWLLGWFLVTSGIAIARYLAARWFEQAKPPESHYQRWALLGIGLIALQALSWIGVLGMVEHTRHTMDIAFVVFLLCALSFSGLTLFGFFLPAYLVFAVPLFGALWIWLLTVSSGDFLWLAVTVAFGSLAIFDSARSSSRLIRQTLELGFEREELVRRLGEEKELAEVTLRSIGDGVLTTDIDGFVTSLNLVAERLTGWSHGEARGRPLSEVLRLLDEATGSAIPDLVRLCRHRGGLVVLEQQTLLSHRAGERESAVEVSVSPIRGHDRNIGGVVIVLRDVTELRGMAQVVSFQASHDPLTGLANRPAFEARVWQALESARDERREHAVCYIDLDQFKLINDTCGHIAGDELLKQVAELLSQHVREVDMVARLGGDEFGVLLFGCGLLKARHTAEGICAAMRDFRFEWEGKTFKAAVSIGLVPLDADSTPTGLLAAADAACYIAKERGRGRVHIAHPRDRELVARHGEVQWTMHIQHALDHDLFRLRYQRIVSLDGAGEAMAEVLLSIDDSDGAPVAPGRFLPAAERFNMMPNIDRRVIQMVFERIRRGGPLLDSISRFNINLSGQSLNDERFLDHVLQQLTSTGVDPRRIAFEITETAVIANMTRARRFIDALRSRGCAFALDDFGSGLSSFAYLRTLPVDYLKIDGLFVKHMSADAIDHSMVEAINQVGHIMGIRTIAESVEEEATLVALRRLGVDYAQGHAVHSPEWFD
ncbi:MAG TPA: EAL domain-containing protein [Gammaproteobacteria bacterium]|nr:EAL domain-containing protein [Gammaproteobacteria bacterium]